MRPNYRQLFRDRLRREGRLQDYLDRVTQIKAELGYQPGPRLFGDREQFRLAAEAHRRAREEFGYLGKYEVEESEEWLAKKVWDRASKKQVQANKLQKQKARMAKRIKDFNEALESLPGTAPPDKEVDWVGGHPAMCRLDRGDLDPEKGIVVITTEDIFKSCAGPAPSRRAVIMLQHWSNRPSDFQKAMVSEQKKATGTPSEANEDKVVDDPQVVDIERMLASLTASVKNG